MASTDPIYKINNKEVPASTIKLAAEQNGITFEEYVTRRGAVLVPGKKTDSTITNPNVESGNTDLGAENGSSELPKDNDGITFGEPIDYDFDNPEEKENLGRRFIQLKSGGRIFEDTYLQDVKENPRDKYNRLKPDTFEKYVLANKWDPASIGVEGIKEPKKKTTSSEVARKIMSDLKVNFSNTEAQNEEHQAEANALFVPYADRPKTYINTGGLYGRAVTVVEENEEYDTFVNEASKRLNVKRGTGDNPFGSKEAEVLKLANKLYVTDKQRTNYADNLEAYARENESSLKETSVGANLDYIEDVAKKAIKGNVAKIKANQAKAQIMVDAMVLMKDERVALRTAEYNTNEEIAAAQARDKYLADNIVVANQKYEEYFQNDIQSLAYENAENEAILDIAKRSYKNTSIIGANIAATVGETIGGILNVPEWLVVSAESIVTGNSPEETATRMSGYLDFGGDVLQEAGQAFRNSVAKPIDVGDIDSWDDFAYWGTDMVSNQALNTVLMVAAPAASLGIMSSSSAGGKYSDMMSSIENGEAQYTGWQMFAAPAIVGTLEYATEKVSLGQLKGIKTVFKKNNSVQKAATEYINDRILNKNYFLDTAGEGLAEGINTLGNNITDIFLLDNKNVHIWDGVPNATASGAFMSGVIYKAPVVGAKMLSPFAKEDMKPRIFANVQMLNKIELELTKPDLSDSVKKSLKDSSAKIQQANTDIITEQLDNVDGLTDSQKTELIAIDKSKVQVQAEWSEINDDTSVSDDIKAGLLETKNEEYNKLNGEKNAILAKAGADQDILKVQTLLTQIDGKSELKVFETNDKSTSDEQLKAFLIEQGNTEEYAEANKSNYGAFVPDINDPTKEYLVINKDSALEDKVVTTGQHEFLHKVLKQAFASNPELATTMGSLLLKEINTNPELSSPELRGRISQYAELLADPTKDFNEADFFEEVLTTFSEALKNDEVTVNETIASKIGDIIRRAANSLGIRKVKFKTSKDVVNFIRDYNRDFSKAKLSKQLQKFSEGESISTKTAASLKSPKSVLNEINDLVPPSVKTQADYFSPKVFNPIYNATLPNGVISNYIKSKSPSKEVGEKAIAGIQDRLVNYDPAAERKKAGNKEPITFGEFIFANTNFIKLDAKKALFKESEAAKKTTDLDTKEAQSKIAEDDAVKKDRPKFRKLIDSSVLPGFTIKEIGGKLTKVVKVLKSKLDTKVSINKSVSPLIAEVKKAMGKQADIDLKKAMGGKADAQLQKWLLKNKKAILENMTTTWLMGAIPKAIQKSVGGAYKVNEDGTRIKDSYGDFIFVPNFTSDWQGKTIDREKTSTNKSGKTAGGDIVRRLPNIATALSDADFVGSVLQDVSIDADGKMTSGAPIRGKKESMAKAIAEEISLEIFNKELQDENSEVSKAFENNQAALGVVLADAFVEDIARQSERGTVKFSISSPKFRQAASKLLRKSLDIGFEEVVDADGTILLSDEIYKSSEFDGVGKVVRSAFDQGLVPDGKELRFLQSIQASEVIPQSVKDLVKRAITSKSDISVRKALAKDMKVVANALGSDVTNIIGYDGLGFFNRLLDSAASKKDKETGEVIPGATGDFYDFLVKLKEDQPKSKNLPLDLRLEDISPMNSKTGVMGKISRILNKDITADKKIEEYKKLIPEIEAANAQNKILANYIITNLVNLVKDGGISPQSFISILQAQTNATAGLRSLTGLKYITFKDGPQGNMKGEHLADNGTSMFEIAELGFENNTDKELAFKVDEILEFHDQWLENRETLDLVDVFGKNNPYKDLRIYLLPEADQSFVYSYDLRPAKELVDSRSEAIKNQIKFSKAIDFKEVKTVETQQKAINNARSIKWSQSPKKIRVFDFDDTLARTKSNVLYTMPDGTTGKIDAATFAKEAGKMEANGAQWDFSEFSKVMNGQAGPLLEVAKIIADKRGTKDVFVLTARPADSAGPIQEFLASVGLNIPIENITGLGNGTPKAKADWIIDKVADGYNDFYFADDHTGNVKAVKDALDTFDVKGKVQLAKVKFSQSLDTKFNDMIERQKGVESFKEFSKATAQRRGKKTGKFKFFISPSAEDFRGLTQYKFAGKGKQGEADQKFFEESLMDPYFQGIAALESARQVIKEDTKALLKTFKPVRKKLNKLIAGEQYTYDAAVRVYLWNKAGEEVPGLSKRDNKKLNDLVANDPELSSFADGLLMVSKKDVWPAPSEYWMAQTTLSDLNNLTEKTNRKEYLAEFIENVDIIFSEKNLNKVEALYGEASRKAIENSIYAMKSGSNSPNQSGDAITSKWMNWVNSSIGTIMFFNRRSAVLQTLSAANFINWSDNNPAKAAIAFANQPQYWKDFVTIFNSDKLKQRRGGLKSDVQEAEIANAAKNSQDKAQAVISYILKIGFTPTQIADSFAISMGGATLYRNRINTYKKQGLSLKEAETKAFEDFSKLSDEAQQSGDPALVSQQQRSVAGRLILSFQNTTMQYTRLMKKSGQDLINGRGDAKTHISKILYYGAIQNFLFNALSKTAFALIPGFEEEDEEDEDKKNQAIEKKAAGILDGMTDSIIRGTGIYGAIFTTLKNSISIWKREDEKGFTGDQTKTIIELANLAPAIGSKLRKVYSSIQTRQFDRDIIAKHPWDVTIDGKFNPSSTYTIIANLSSAAFNVPLDRALAEARSVGEMLDDRNSKFQRIALALGWRTWNVGAKNEEFDLIKLEGKAKRKIEGKEKAKRTRAAKKEKEKQRVANLSAAEKLKERREKIAEKKKKALAKRREKLRSRLTKNKK